jgi:uncharacterized membrane protein YedE/YeeE
VSLSALFVTIGFQSSPFTTLLHSHWYDFLQEKETRQSAEKMTIFFMGLILVKSIKID